MPSRNQKSGRPQEQLGVPEISKPEASAWRNARRFCHVNPNLISIKLMMLLFYGGMTALYPFLTVHMRSIGLTITDTAIVYTFLPFVSAVGPPLFGALADKIGNYKVILILVNLASIVFHLLICFAVPPVVSNVAPADIALTRLNATFPCLGTEIDISSVQLEKPNDCRVPAPDQLLFDGRSSAVFLHCALKCNDTYHTNRTVCLSHPQCVSLGDDLAANFQRFTARDITGLNRSGHVVDEICRVDAPELCLIRCNVRLDTTIRCNRSETPFSARLTTFCMYMVFRLIATSTIYAGFSILDSAAYQMAEQHQGNLGIQRMFSLVGICVFPPVSGFLVGLASDQAGAPDYKPAFYIYCGAHGLAMVVSFFMKIDLRKTSDKIWSNVGKLLSNLRILGFVAMAFFAGCAWGILENYLFLFMEDIGSPKWLLGMTNTVSALSAIPVIAASTAVINLVGHTNLTIICVMLYGVRFLSYSVTYNPYFILPAEVLEAFTTSLLWVVISVYCGKIAPEYLATVQGITASAHNCLGRGVGGLVGGIAFANYGSRTSYRIFGGFFMGLGVFYFVLFYVYLRKLPYESGDEDLAAPAITASEEDEQGLPTSVAGEVLSPIKRERSCTTGQIRHGLSTAGNRENSAMDTADVIGPRLRPLPARSSQDIGRRTPSPIMAHRKHVGSIGNRSAVASTASRRHSQSWRGSQLSRADSRSLSNFARTAALSRSFTYSLTIPVAIGQLASAQYKAGGKAQDEPLL